MNLSPSAQTTLDMAMVYAIPDIVDKAPPGRLRNRIDKLRKDTALFLSKCKPVIDSEREYLERIVLEFAKNSGWGSRKRHVSTYASFCLALIDGKGYPQSITDSLVDIIDYFERRGENRQLCYAAGLIAKEKLEGILGKGVEQ